MINLEEWVMIKHMHRQGVPKARIAREMGLDPRTVDRAVNSEEHPERKAQHADRRGHHGAAHVTGRRSRRIPADRARPRPATHSAVDDTLGRQTPTEPER